MAERWTGEDRVSRDAGWLACSVPVAAAAGDGEARGWKGTVYTGAPLDSWYYGTVYMDVAGVNPSRQDIPALREHDRRSVAGWTTKIEASGRQVTVAGRFLAGSAEEEPDAATVARRLGQGYPMQMSGLWIPLRIESVEAGAKATVNGETVLGPCVIFRETDLAEVSFCACGKDPMTQAEAAAAGSGDAATVRVEVVASGNVKEKAMADKTTTAGDGNAPEATSNATGGALAVLASNATGGALAVLASLQGAVGPQRAIDLVTANPEASSLADFADDLVGEITTLRASLESSEKARVDAESKLTTARAEAATLRTELAAAKRAPVVVTATGDGAAPPAAPPAADTPEAWRAEFAASKDLQAEYVTADRYVLWMTREQGRRR